MSLESLIGAVAVGAVGAAIGILELSEEGGAEDTEGLESLIGAAAVGTVGAAAVGAAGGVTETGATGASIGASASNKVIEADIE